MATTLLAAAFGLAACNPIPSPTPAPAPVGQISIGALEHIHAMGVDADTGLGYVATHVGLYPLPPLDAPEATAAELGEPIGGDRIDAMGFAVDAGVLYASGHPEPSMIESFTGPNLGLISMSADAEKWEHVSLTGEIDFHDLEVDRAETDPIVYGYDATAGRMLVSRDGGASWSEGATITLRDFTAVPALPGTLYATTLDGLSVSRDFGATFTALPDAPALLLVAATDSQSGDGLVGVDSDGNVWSTSRADTWTVTGSVTGDAQALAYTGSPTATLIVADDRGIVTSTNGGETWNVLIRIEDE